MTPADTYIRNVSLHDLQARMARAAKWNKDRANRHRRDADRCRDDNDRQGELIEFWSAQARYDAARMIDSFVRDLDNILGQPPH